MSEKIVQENILPTEDDIFEGKGIEVCFQQDSDFLRVREVLTRMGEAKGNDLYQTCYILHKRGRYIIAHYHELMSLDGSPVEISEQDIAIRNKMADLLEEWNLLIFVNPDIELQPIAQANEFKVILYKERRQWNLVSRYQIGVDKRPNRKRRKP